jgi:hypothetical protein
MSRALDRAYDIILAIGEKFSVQNVAQIRVEQERTPDMALVTDGTGGLKLVSVGNLGGGTTLPTPPLGGNDALTVDPAGVVRWGGQISSGSF